MIKKITNYKGLEIGKDVPNEVTGEEVEKELDKLVSESKTFEAKEGASENGNVVTIDFEGFLNDVPFEGGKGEKYDLELGSGTFIPGFEEQLVGHKKGENVDVNVTFPENYHAENLAGKPVVFKCYIHEVKVLKVTEANDELAKMHGLNTLEELITAITNKLRSEKRQEVFTNYLNKITEEIVSKSEFEIAQENIDKKVEEFIGYQNEMLSQYGMNLDSYLQMRNMTMEAFRKECEVEAIHMCKIDDLHDYVIKNENLTVTEEEFNNEIFGLKNYYKLSDEQINAFINERGDLLRRSILINKVGMFLFENNN